MNKLALGTVQFGLKYGIANKNGQIIFEDVKKILEFARNVNIDLIDTANFLKPSFPHILPPGNNYTGLNFFFPNVSVKLISEISTNIIFHKNLLKKYFCILY